jgi:hypothetical protein
MAAQLNELVALQVVYRHTASGQPFNPVDAQITVIAPDGTTTTTAASQVGATFVWKISVTLNQAGTWVWFPVTTDEDITPTDYGTGVLVGQTWIEDVNAPVGSIPTNPLLDQ